jgi:hypothetical protein
MRMNMDLMTEIMPFKNRTCLHPVMRAFWSTSPCSGSPGDDSFFLSYSSLETAAAGRDIGVDDNIGEDGLMLCFGEDGLMLC